jgi:hypothetical protein
MLDQIYWNWTVVDHILYLLVPRYKVKFIVQGNWWAQIRKWKEPVDGIKIYEGFPDNCYNDSFNDLFNIY